MFDIIGKANPKPIPIRTVVENKKMSAIIREIANPVKNQGLKLETISDKEFIINLPHASI